MSEKLSTEEIKKGYILRRSIRVIQKEGIITFVKKSLTYITKETIKVLFFPCALLRIKYFTHDNNLDKLVNFALNDFIVGKLIKPGQIQEEILECLKIVDKIKPKIVLEIGTAGGGTLFLFSRVASEDATIISIDLPGGEFGRGYPKWKIPLYKAFKLPKQKLHLIRGNSHHQETLGKLKELLGGEKLDFVFIDGDHTYEGVKKDFEMYSPLVKAGAIIAFHDIIVYPPEDGCEVDKLWSELKRNYNHREIIKEPKQNWGGIGMVYLR